MKWSEILTEASAPVHLTAPRLLYRWVDFKAAAPYLRQNIIKARVRHFLPAKLSGLPHSRVVVGISFSENPTQWRSGSDQVCFVLDREKIPNKIVDINGQAIYVLSQNVQAVRDGVSRLSREEYDRQVAQVMTDCRTNPDECFVIGDLRDLKTCLVDIKTDNTDPQVISKLRRLRDAAD